MGRSRSSSGLLPSGLIIEQVRIDDGGVASVARSRDVGSACPGCGKLSRPVHSRYVRSLSDLPAHGRRFSIALTVRRFRCSNDVCPRMIFAERFGEDIVAPYARRMERSAEWRLCVFCAATVHPGRNGGFGPTSTVAAGPAFRAEPAFAAGPTNDRIPVHRLRRTPSTTSATLRGTASDARLFGPFVVRIAAANDKDASSCRKKARTVSLVATS